MTTPSFVIVHIGDVHLHPGPRQADRLRALDQIIRECEVLDGLGAWVIPGDIFHKRSTVEDRNEFLARVQWMADVAPVLIVYGNHDAGGDLDVFAAVGARFPIHVWSTPETRAILLPSGHRLYVFGMPFPTEAGLVSEGVAVGTIGQTAREHLDRIFIAAGDELTRARAAGFPTLMIGHVNVAGSISSSGQPQIGKEIEIDKALLDRLGDCPKLLNHIHAAQDVGGASYAGSICRLDWGETENKTYSVISLAGNTWGIERKPIAVAAMYRVFGEMSRAGFTWKCVDAFGAETAAPETFAGCEVRVRMRYQQSEGVVLANVQEEIKTLFSAALRFEFEPVCVPDRGLRAPEVQVARTLREKIEAWSAVAGVTLPADVGDKADALASRDSDALVADVDATLSALSTIVQREAVEQ